MDTVTNPGQHLYQSHIQGQNHDDYQGLIPQPLERKLQKIFAGAN